jgi:hypothetical protein
MKPETRSEENQIGYRGTFYFKFTLVNVIGF